MPLFITIPFTAEQAQTDPMLPGCRLRNCISRSGKGRRSILALLFLSVFFASGLGQVVDSSKASLPLVASTANARSQVTAIEKFRWKSYILPGTMIVYGLASLHSEDLQDLNDAIKDEVYEDQQNNGTNIDHFLAFAPAISVYGLNAVGIHGKHNFRDRTGIYAISSLLAATSVSALKAVTHQLRPDNSTYNSFPSGHTAQAFAGAEFMRREYKDVSPWYGIAGYAMAITTGYLRMYNNRHWFGDVVAGAGIGIASTNFAYWVYPRLKRHFSKKQKDNGIMLPYYQQGTLGIVLVRNF